MNRFDQRSRLAGLLAPVVIVTLSGAIAAQAQQPATPPAPAPAPAASGEPIKVPIPAEQDPTPPSYTYEVGGRRDPFKSLLIREKEGRTDRVPGLPGMLVEELDLQGTIKMRSGWVAMMRGSDNKSYLLRKGATVFDGEVTDITGTEVTFRQNVNDPTNPKPFRDVVKSLALQRKP